jgi:hypothetical protein
MGAIPKRRKAGPRCEARVVYLVILRNYEGNLRSKCIVLFHLQFSLKSQLWFRFKDFDIMSASKQQPQKESR